MSTNLSPRPWVVNRKQRKGYKDGLVDVSVVDAEGNNVVWCGWENKAKPFNGADCHPVGVAGNAALIAAAPDLLSHAEQILDMLPPIDELQANAPNIAEWFLRTKAIIERIKSNHNEP